MARILIVDDETGVLASFQKLLSGADHETLTASRGEEALALLEDKRPDVLVMDIRMPGMDGLETFRKVRALRPRLPVIIMTGYGTTGAAIEATKLGAYDYLLKPFDPAEMLRAIAGALECVRLMSGEVRLGPGESPGADEAIIGQSAGMQRVYKAIGRVAETDATVLIRGETGTGKELVARAIYQHSRRAARPLLAVNCAAIPETLLESELFGHERGAFTGANARRIGKFEQARGGTVFLDEIGDIPLAIQAKLLRVLQEKSFQRLGGNDTVETDVRVIAATNRRLEEAISSGQFREDLYHRLNVFTVDIPPLRDRREDVPRLAAYFLERLARELGVERPMLSDAALMMLEEQPWPGNVRQLENCLQRAVISTRGYPIQPEDIRRALERPAAQPGAETSGPLKDKLREIVREYLQFYKGPSVHAGFLDLADKLIVSEALQITGGNQTRAARLLGLTRPTLQAKMQKHGIRRETRVSEE